MIAHTNGGALACDAEQIAEWLRVLIEPGQVVELRALDVRRKFGNPVTMSGFFDSDHLAEMAKAAIKLDPFARGIYFTLNPLHRDLLSRCANRVDVAKRGESTSAEHILRRRWLLIDCDPVRIAGVSSTDDELQQSEKLIREVDEFLFEERWPTPIRAMSSNGHHLLFPIDLPRDDGDLVKRFLVALAAKFSTDTDKVKTDKAKIDTAVFDAPRICKMYGTIGKKGDSTVDRPHRQSEIVSIPEKFDIVSAEQIERSIELLERLAAQAPAEEPEPEQQHKNDGHTPRHNTNGDAISPGEDFNARGDIRPTLQKHGWTRRSEGQNEHWTRPGKDHGTSATLKAGNFHVFTSSNPEFEPNKDYGPFSVFGILEHGGDFSAAAKSLAAMGYGTPKSKGQAKAKEKSAAKQHTPILAAGTKVRCGDRGNIGTVVSSDDDRDTVSVHFVSPAGIEVTKDIPRGEVTLADGTPVVPTAIVTPPIRTARDIVGTYHKLREPLIDGLLRQGETLNLIASTKVGKSWLATNLALAFVTERPWLDRFETAGGNVLLIDNELHIETSAYRIPCVANANGITLDDYADKISVMNLRGALIDLPTLATILEAIEPGRFKLICLDAFYRLLPLGTDENANADMTALYNILDRVASKLGCGFINIHHSSKGDQSGKSVTDTGSGAGAMARATDTHIVLRPHQDDDMVVMEAVTRSWPPVEPLCLRWRFPTFTEDLNADPTLLRQARPKRTTQNETSRDAERSERDRVAHEKHRDEILKAYRDFPDGETANKLRDAAGLSGRQFGPLNLDLLREGIIESCDIKKGYCTYAGFRLNPKRSDNSDNSDCPT